MPTDDWTWRAVYNEDGTDYLDEHEEDGTPHRFSEIDQTRLLAFLLLPQRDGLTAHALQLEPWQRLVFFRRTSMTSGDPTPRKIHVYGFQATIHGQNIKCLVSLFENGGVLVGEPPDTIPYLT